MPLSSKQVRSALIGTAGLLVGLGVGYFLFGRSANISPGVTREGGYELVNPLLACNVSYTPSKSLSMLRQKLQATIDGLVKEGKAQRVSVYFRDMDYGNWTGVNENDSYIPASLMKVPLLLAYLKEENDNDPSIISRTLYLSDTDQNAGEFIKPLHPLALGTSYAVSTLLEAMIRESDNNAAAALNAAIATSTIANVYTRLGLPPGDNTSENMSPKTYMDIFRVLYNATYLYRPQSQDVLALLSTTEFKDGLVAGVPSSITVAHKFGERSVYSDPSKKTLLKRELHDCGIVYYPGSPYGLCVMTEGQNFTDLEASIAAVSAIAYQAVAAGALNAER